MTPVLKKVKAQAAPIWYIRLYDKVTGKRPYLMDERGDILQFKSKEKAQDFIKSEKARKDRHRTLALRKKINDTQYHSIQNLVEDFIPTYKASAPNSWERAEQYMRDYILPFFLVEKGEGNLEEWGDLADDFKSNLAKAKPQKGKKDTLAKATQNHIFVVLNLFIKFAVKKKKLSTPFNVGGYKEKELNRRNEEAVIPEEESERILKAILTWEPTAQNQQFYVFYKLLLNSGMRFSEGVGLALGGYVDSPLDESHALSKALKSHSIINYGHIILEDQLHRGVRKKLKSKEESDSRLIPITDKKLAEELSELCADAVDKWNAKKVSKAYLVFYELNKSTADNLLKKAYIQIGLPYKSYHNLRHTFTTLLVERTFNTLLTKTITGHDSKSFDRYLHIANRMKQQAKQTPDKLGYFKRKK